MSNVIQLSDYRRSNDYENQFRSESGKEATALQRGRTLRHSLVPLEFGLAEPNREKCLELVNQFQLASACAHAESGCVDEPNHFISIEEAIWFNRQILSVDTLSEGEATARMDLIQSLENLCFTPLDDAWQLSRQA